MMVGEVCGLMMRQEIGSAGAAALVAKHNLEATPAHPHIRRVRSFQSGGDCERAGQYSCLPCQQRDQAQKSLQAFQQRTTATLFES